MISILQTCLVLIVSTMGNVLAIYNGYAASPNSAKFAGLMFGGCSCVLVSDRIVLSASHCFENAKPAGVMINRFNQTGITGKDFLNATAYNAPILQISGDTISVIILEEPVEICENNETALPLPLPIKFIRDSNGNYSWKRKFSNDQLINGSLCRNYGFGSTDERDDSVILRYCDYQYQEFDEATALISERSCDGETRNGDSGSPTLCQIDGQYHLLGTLYGTFGNLPAHELDAWNDIRSYGDFILKTLLSQNLLEGYLRSEEKCKSYVENYQFEESYCQP